MSKVVNPGTVHLILPKKAAAAKACRKLLAMPNSPERVADLINKLSGIMFKDEENKFIRYEWILLILKEIFRNEPFTEDLEAFLDQAQDTIDSKSASESQSIDGVNLSEEDFSDLGIPDFDELFDKAENQFTDMEENLKNLKDLCSEFLLAVEILLDLNNTKRDQLEQMIDVNGQSISFSNFMDSFLNGDMLENFSFDQLMSMIFALPPGVLEKLLNKLDDMFFQSMLKRKFYNLSLKRYLGRISYYKESESENDYLKSKLEDYQQAATQANEKIGLIEKETKQILKVKSAVEEHIGAEVDVQAQADAATKTPEELKLDEVLKSLPEIEPDVKMESSEQAFKSVDAHKEDDASKAKDKEKEVSKDQRRDTSPKIDD